MLMYQQVYDPVSHSLGTSSIFAAIPLVTLFVLLGGFKVAAHIASVISLAVAIVIATVVYPMPIGQALDSGLEGACFGLFPIMFIVVNAVWIYNLTVKTGDFAVLRRSFAKVSDDQRIQAIIIAFAFGALLEALAGFGTPVAICSVMLIALGFQPIKAVTLALIADTAPVAFGAIAIPITTLASVTGLPQQDLGSMVGRQTPLVAFIVPLILVIVVDGWRGVRATWPAALVAGFSFGIAQFATSNYISVELADIVASLLSVGSIVALLRVWQPKEKVVGEASRQRTRSRPTAVAGAESYNPALELDVRRKQREERDHDSGKEILRAYSPYLIIIAVFSIIQIGPIKTWLTDSATKMVDWPGLHVTNGKGEALTSLKFKLDYLSSPGSVLLICGLLTLLALRIRPGLAIRTYGSTLKQLATAIITVAAVLGLAYVMNQSGQTITIAQWLAGAGAAFAFLSPILGWLGTSITGSDTSSNALFGALQVQAAHDTGLNQTLLAAGNSSGGVLGKMISPQNLAIGAAAVGMSGKEGILFRKVVGWSLLMILIMAVLVYLQSTSVLSWMVV
jgi:lactate permease